MSGAGSRGADGRSEQRNAIRGPSMARVAEVAGVSAQTVSRVLSEHPHVSPDTRFRVLAAVEQTGYRRNGLARALVTGRTSTLGVLCHESDHHSSNAILLGIQLAARDHGYHVSTSSTSSLSTTALERAAARLLDQAVDGILVLVPAQQGPQLERITGGLPLVVMDQIPTTPTETVGFDQELAGRLATEHLLELGHQTVWHLSGPDDWVEAMGRARGWEQTLTAADREVPPLLFGDWSPESGYRNGLLLGRLDDLSAVFVASDEMAFGVLHGLRERGREVPGDVSVVGMDDIPLAAHCSPPLTTVRQSFHHLGRRAVEHLVSLLTEPDAPHHPETIRPVLVVRASTAAPAS